MRFDLTARGMNSWEPYAEKAENIILWRTPLGSLATFFSPYRINSSSKLYEAPLLLVLGAVDMQRRIEPVNQAVHVCMTYLPGGGDTYKRPKQCVYLVRNDIGPQSP